MSTYPAIMKTYGRENKIASDSKATKDRFLKAANYAIVRHKLVSEILYVPRFRP